jgi:hypothetical protein
MSVAGKEVIAPPAADEPSQVINLMDALKRSVELTQKKGAAEDGPEQRQGTGRAEAKIVVKDLGNVMFSKVFLILQGFARAWSASPSPCTRS